MADRPILFSGPMVRALLAGTKTQTRRGNHLERVRRFGPITEFGQSDTNGYDWHFRDRGMRWHDLRHPELLEVLPYQIGDRLYVREHWRTGGQHDHIAPRDLPQEWAGPIGYIADEAPNTISRTGRFRQGMHMPRWASRLTLTVTEVLVERLQDISEAAALAEGMTQATADATMSTDELQVYAATHIVAPQARRRILYEAIWEQINGAGSWAKNPWVAAYSFTVEHGNIDQLARAA